MNTGEKGLIVEIDPVIVVINCGIQASKLETGTNTDWQNCGAKVNLETLTVTIKLCDMKG